MFSGPAPLWKYKEGTYDMSHRRITTKQMNALAFGGPCKHPFKTLMLGFNEIGDEGLINTLGWFDRHYNGVMSRLDISFNNLTDASAIAMGSSDVLIDHLEHLHLAGNRISGIGFSEFAKGWSRESCKLSYLDVSGNNANVEGAVAIGQLVQSPSCCLETLVIKGNQIGPRGAEALAAALVVNTTLTSLNVSNNNIGDEGMGHLAKALDKNRLRELNFSFNDVSSAGIVALEKSLGRCTNLNSLILDNNRLGNEGATALIDCIAPLNITKLGLSFNKIETAGVKKVLLLLPQTLTKLNISGNRITSSVVEELFDVLANTSIIQELNIDHHKIGEAGRIAIASGIASNRTSRLRNFVGFALGPVMTKLDSPVDMEHFNNDKVLSFLGDLWMAKSAATEPSGSFSQAQFERDFEPKVDRAESDDDGVLDAASLTSHDFSLDQSTHNQDKGVTCSGSNSALASDKDKEKEGAAVIATTTTTSTTTTAEEPPAGIVGQNSAHILLAAAVTAAASAGSHASAADDAGVDDTSVLSRTTSFDGSEDGDEQMQQEPLVESKEGAVAAGKGALNMDEQGAEEAAGGGDSFKYLHDVAMSNAINDAAASGWHKESGSKRANAVAEAVAITKEGGIFVPSPEMYSRFKRVPPEVLTKLRDLAAQPFHPGELWELNQRYFGVASGATNADGESLRSSEGSSECDDDEPLPHVRGGTITGQKSARRGSHQPSRAKLRRIATRIESYPGVMAQVAELHESSDDAQILVVLRKLHFLEQSRREGVLEEDLDIGALLLFLL